MNTKPNKTSFKKGLIPWNKGKPHPQTPEQAKKRIALLPRGEDHHMFGKHHSISSKKKISAKLLGRKKPPFTEEHKENMRISAKKRKMPPITQEHRQHLSESRKGHKTSEETRKKIGRANWKNGLTPLYSLIRHSFEYRQWRDDVFTRDNWTCVWCWAKGTINADHIKPFYLIIKENNIKSFEEAKNCPELWNINNGRTLCVNCHKKTESYMRKPKYI